MSSSGSVTRLIRRVKDGDAAAGHELFARYFRRVLGLALSCVLFAIMIQAVSLMSALASCGVWRWDVKTLSDPPRTRGRLRVRPEESATAPATCATFEPELDDTSPSRRRAAHI